METETTKNKNYVRLIILLLFIVFIILYISKETGYYEFKAHEKAVMTEESIKKFEQDIADGKNVKASDYITSDYMDYSNKFTKVGSKLTQIFEDFMSVKVKKGIKVLSKLFWE